MASPSPRWLPVLAALVVALVVALAVQHGRHEAPGATARVDSPAAATRLAAVERVVAERNQDVGKDEQAFKAAGWQMVDVPPPDERLTSSDPSLIAEGREQELRTQLASTTPSPAQAHRLAQIALLAHDPVTRESAVDALGRIRTPEARDELIGLLVSGKLEPRDLGRRQIAALIQPADLEDSTAAKMANLIDNDALTPVEKQQIAFTLALVGLRDGMTLPQNVLETMSPAARALVDQMTALGRKSFLARGDDHDHED
jgi:hypothetical protein